ncbi:MAG: acetolactate synthase [Opitutales bacterium]|nr:acetolactate synthase [Opitutales bacterium]
MGADITERPRRVPVRQFSVFADNKVGRLNELVQLLAKKGIHILAFSQLDTTECTIMRFIVDYHEEARDFLRERGYAFSEVEVIAVEIASEADLKHITAALVEAEINIHYLYSFIMRPQGKSGLALSLEDNDMATDILNCKGLRVLDQTDLAR